MLNKISNLKDIWVRSIFKLYWNNRMKLSLLFREVTVGKNLTFVGKTHIKKGSKNSIIIGDNCTFLSTPASNLIGINRPCILSSIGEKGSSLIIGNNCGFSGTIIGCFSQITLGDNVRCGANTLITDSDWHLDDPRTSDSKPITIHDNVWLGANVIVMKGVSIGENSIIGAGSVVTKHIPSNVIAAGNPCKVIKDIK